MNYKRKWRRRFFLLMRSRTPPIPSEFRGGFEHPKPPLGTPLVRRKHPKKWRTNSWFLLHDNAPAHRTVLVKDLLAKNYLTTLEHTSPPPHPPNLAPADFYLFPRKGWHFVMLLTSLRMWQKSWKGCHKMASKNVSNTFTVTGRSVWLHKGPFWRKCSLNYWTVLNFSKIKWFWEHFGATVYCCTFCYLYQEWCRQV